MKKIYLVEERVSFMMFISRRAFASYNDAFEYAESKKRESGEEDGGRYPSWVVTPVDFCD